MKRTLLILASTLALLAGPVTAADETLIVDQSKPLVATSNKQQRFADYLDLKPGQEKLPLTMTFYNGGDRAPGYAWLRVSIAGNPFLTEKDFRGGKVLTQDISGVVGAGSSQILVLGGGVAGSTASWTVSAPKVDLTALKPDKGLTGESVVLTGVNFSPAKASNVVRFGDATAEIVDAKPTSLTVKVPASAKAGENKVSVTTYGMKTKELKFKVKVIPQLSGLTGGNSPDEDLQSAPTETQVYISGQNFGEDKGVVKVFFGDIQAPVLSVTPTKIVTSIPEMPMPTWGVPITVSVDDVKSKNSLSINVQSRVW